MKTLPDPNSPEFNYEARRIEEMFAKTFNMKGIVISFRCCPSELVFMVRAGAERPDYISGALLETTMTAAIADNSDLRALAVEGQTFSSEGNLIILHICFIEHLYFSV